jgi:molybdate transport system substrate-binding protein
MRYKHISVCLTLFVAVILVISFSGCSNEIKTTAPVTATQIPSTNSTQSISSPNQVKTISVFAGSASKPPLDEAARAFEKKTGLKVFLTYGGSGTVLSQMELAKTGDVYIPGSPDYLIKAEKKQITDPATTQIIAYLIPAICVQPGNPQKVQSLADLAKPGLKVGIGNPDSVCVGLYAIEILDKNNLLYSVFPNIVTQATSCDATATLISLRSVDAVIGWSVFQDWDSKHIERVYLKPEQLPRLAYIPAAVSTFSKDKALSVQFIAYLVSPEGQDIFKKWGYNVTEADARQFAPKAQIGGEYQLPEAYKALVK